MTKLKAKLLLERYNKGKATESERKIIDGWYKQLSNVSADLDEDELDELAQLVWNKLPVHKEIKSSKVFNLLKFSAVAATVAAFFIIGIYFWTQRIDAVVSDTELDIVAVGNRAFVTMSDGTKIVLDDKKDGVLLENRFFSYLDGTTIEENTKSTITENFVTSISTPRGGQYKVQLPDGTKVWLNAMSSISYKIAKDGKKREAQLTGEAFFEVVKSTKPFIVKTENQLVEVLGTHFNVNAYADEILTTTTLMEGSVRVATVDSDGEILQTALLKPNQQSTISSDNSFFNIRNVNTSIAKAWKEGVFHFENTDIKSVMRQISRWYDVDVEYSGTLEYEPFFGEIKRDYSLSEVLRILEIGGVNFKASRNKDRIVLTVQPGH